MSMVKQSASIVAEYNWAQSGWTVSHLAIVHKILLAIHERQVAIHQRWSLPGTEVQCVLQHTGLPTQNRVSRMQLVSAA